jgi:hypothetical protein
MGWRDSQGLSRPTWNRDVDPATRRQHSRDGLHCETDAEWALIEPLMPKPLAKGRPRERPLREVINVIFYVLPRRRCVAAAPACSRR